MIEMDLIWIASIIYLSLSLLTVNDNYIIVNKELSNIILKTIKLLIWIRRNNK